MAKTAARRSDFKTYAVRDNPGAAERFIGVRDSDFATLAKAAGGGMEVDTANKGQAKMLGELQRAGLIRFTFRDRNGWPVAVALLTPIGAQILAQDPQVYARAANA